MDVRRGDEPIRLDAALDDDRLTVRVGRRLVERDVLARDWVVDRVRNGSSWPP
jgi:hypothetical protein